MSSFTWKRVEYINRSGLRLAGLLYADKPKGTVIVVCHGFTGSKEGGGRAVTMAEGLGARGYATLLFDFSGCGESEGEFADVTLTRHISDVQCSVTYCRELGFERVLTMGRSFGGTAAICLGRANGVVSGVCTLAAPGAVRELFARLRTQTTDRSFDLLKLSSDEKSLQIKKSFLADLDGYDVFNKVVDIAPNPLLIIHGDADQVVPEKNAWLIYKSAGDPKKIEIIRNADHQFTGCYEDVWKVYFDWLAEYFPT